MVQSRACRADGRFGCGYRRDEGKKAEERPPRGTSRRRGNSLQVAVYAGEDPVTGRRLYLRESTTSEPEARRILRRLTAQVDGQRHAKTKATFRVVMESWLRTHELDETTRTFYRRYGGLHLYPAFGDEPIGKSLLRCSRSSTPIFGAAVRDATTLR